MTDFSSNSSATLPATNGPKVVQPEIVVEATGDGIVEALKRQVVLYEQIQLLGKQQSDYVENGQAESLLALLSQRQRLIAGLTAINDQLAPVRSAWATFVGTLNDQQKGSIATLTQRIDSLRQSILDQDDRDRATLGAARDAVGKDLRKIANTGQAARAYQSGPAASAVSGVASSAAIETGNESTLDQSSKPTVMPAQSRFTDRQG